jgi:hypothetical protein
MSCAQFSIRKTADLQNRIAGVTHLGLRKCDAGRRGCVNHKQSASEKALEKEKSTLSFSDFVITK